MRKDFDPDIYVKYASVRHPETLDPKVYFAHTERSLTIFEPFQKAYMHLILMPRVASPPFTEKNLIDLHTLLASSEISKEEAHKFLLGLQEDAEQIVKRIEGEMVDRKLCTWSIWVGFHAAPSLNHLHLHIISSDLTGDGLKQLSHYNRFHPTLGYFMHLKDVLLNFDKHMWPAYDKMVKFLQDKAKRRRMLKTRLEDLQRDQCYHENCREKPKTILDLKEHLQWHFERTLEIRREQYEIKQRLARQRQRREEAAMQATIESSSSEGVDQSARSTGSVVS